MFYDVTNRSKYEYTIYLIFKIVSEVQKLYFK